MGDDLITPPPPRYRIISYVSSNEHDDNDWFALEIRLNGTLFHVGVRLSKFRNSPSLTQKFHQYLACLKADGDDYDEDKSADMETGQEAAGPAVTIIDCFSWAVDPCLELFESVAPPPNDVSSVTLLDFFRPESFDCQLGAVDDHLVPGPLEDLTVEGETPPPGFEDEPKHSPWTTTFPSFRTSQVEIEGQIYYFKAVQPPGDNIGQREVSTYEKITAAGLEPDVRISRLYGIVVDENQQLTGLLLHLIPMHGTLEYALEPDTPPSVKQRWAGQIKETLACLHQNGIIWGDAKPDNIIIDTDRDAWIVDFGGGQTQGWVDRANMGTTKGDLEGLENILEFISTGGIEDSP
ncbi:hypothetical protein NM208_g11305 [Fusarium decemcellulare]|uniref:Uncharacterized protein n=1 Tax=Fusarium decemcellulare TaxID=57161 RepID=A0ACC1RUK7_9HYPO|nr:hypothetical protein NM208_g11305 [Fusarium decemcellulare]